MNKYRLISKKGEGTFSEVLKAQCLKNSKYVAIKCMKNHFDNIDKVNNLREIQALRRLSPHPHVVKLHEVLYDQPTGRLALVFELMDMNIYELIRGRRHYLQHDRVKFFLYQLLKAMDHMHRNGIFHRDIKPENILISNDQLKVADFGSCRGIYSKPPYTEYISTRWYRAPECLLTDGYYGYKMDMWGVGCVMFEVLALFPLFPGKNELDQIERIHNILGTPPKQVLDKFKKYATHMEFKFQPKTGTGLASMLTHCSAECIDLIEKLLAYDPEDRISARQALRHPYFKELRAKDKLHKQAAKNAAATEAGGANANSAAGVVSTSMHAAETGDATNSKTSSHPPGRKGVDVKLQSKSTKTGNSSIGSNNPKSLGVAASKTQKKAFQTTTNNNNNRRGLSNQQTSGNSTLPHLSSTGNHRGGIGKNHRGLAQRHHGGKSYKPTTQLHLAGSTSKYNKHQRGQFGANGAGKANNQKSTSSIANKGAAAHHRHHHQPSAARNKYQHKTYARKAHHHSSSNMGAGVTTKRNRTNQVSSNASSSELPPISNSFGGKKHVYGGAKNVHLHTTQAKVTKAYDTGSTMRSSYYKGGKAAPSGAASGDHHGGARRGSKYTSPYSQKYLNHQPA